MVTSEQNGFFKVLEDAQLVEPLVVPGCPAPLKTKYTGVGPIDFMLTAISFFFCSLLDGDTPWNWRVSRWQMMYQFGAGWGLLSLEGLRSGNKGKAVAWTGLMGLIFQHIAYTITVPLYLILHLFTSPVAQPTKPLSSFIVPRPGDLGALPFALLLAYIIPSLLMGMSAPDVVTANTHYSLIALWNFIPLWQSVLQALFTLGRSKTEPDPDSTRALGGLRNIYRLFLGLVVAVQLPILAVALTPASAVPAAWAPLLFEVTVSSVLVPRWFTGRPTLEQSLAAGLAAPLAPLAGYFLQYDINCGNLAIAVWAAYFHRAALPSRCLLIVVSKALLWVLLGGPAAVATVLLWERDEALLNAPTEKKQI